MALPWGPGTHVVPFPITNEQFLKAIFGPRWGEVLVSYFQGDPKTARNWQSYPAATVLGVMHAGLNNYYDVSLPGAAGGRTGASFDALYAIVIDDYGVKVDPAKVEQLLGVGPNYIIETSPGSYHAGWFIEPLSDRAWVLGLLRDLYRALGAGDNLVKPTTLVRLPVGTNGKAELPSPFKVKLVHWQPGTRIQHLDWIDIEARLGAAVVPVNARMDLGNLGAAAMPDPAEIEADIILKIFRGRGMVLGLGRSMTFGWGFDVECPWAHEHTDPRTAASYVPVRERFKCHHGHCQDRTVADIREWADGVVREDSGGLECLASLAFDEVPGGYIAGAQPASGSTGRIGPGRTGPGVAGAGPGKDPPVDLWDQKIPPAWPGGIFPGPIEDALHALAVSDGLDLGALGAAMMTVASGAADKRISMRPYTGSPWSVPPVLWTMLVAETGRRKSAILRHVLKRLHELNQQIMRDYKRAIASWLSVPKAQRTTPEPIPGPLLADNVTPETLQQWMSGNDRGLLYIKDELAGMFDFGRYSSGPGTAERAFFLETYEGGPHTVGRMTRTTVIDNCGLAILGGIQPQRLAGFKDLADDGLMSRFAPVFILGDENVARANTAAGWSSKGTPDVDALATAIDALRKIHVFAAYTTDATAEAAIRETEQLGRLLDGQPHIALGYHGFLRKLQGLHARVTLLLHLMDGGTSDVVPGDTAERAMRYAEFLLGHAAVFYDELPGSASMIVRAIGSFLLRHPMKRVTAGQLRRDVAPCRALKSLKEIQDMLFPLVMGGWLVPESGFPSNSAWCVAPGLQDQFAARLVTEASRVEAVKTAMNRLGQYRPTSNAGGLVL